MPTATDNTTQIKDASATGDQGGSAASETRDGRDPQIVQLVLDAVAEWGGTKEIAQDMRDEFQANKPGSVGRLKILGMLTDLLKLKHELVPATNKDTEEMTPEELDAELHTILESACGTEEE
jgi:hypothetical protein